MASSDDVEKNLELFLNTGHVMIYPITTLSVMFLLYGIYLVVFLSSIHTLSRRDCFTSKLYMGGTVSLFILATILVIMEAWGISHRTIIEFNSATTKSYGPLINYLNGDNGSLAWNSATAFFTTFMNTIADSMLIHRCYCVWSSSKYVLYPLACMAFILNGLDLGCVISITIGHSDSSKDSNRILLLKGQPIDNGVAMGIVVFHVLLTFMTGGRIWWISRQLRCLMGRPTHGRYNAIVAIILESGLLYASSLLAMAIVDAMFTSDPSVRGLLPIDVGIVSGLMSGLAPTLIIVRVAPLDTIQQRIPSFRVADSQENHTTTTGQTTIDLQLPVQLNTDGGPGHSEGSLALSAARGHDARMEV